MHDKINSRHTTPKLPQKANVRMEASNIAAPIEPLFDSFWHSRELALLFGAAGTGKSMLAMTLAERIARGKGIEGFVMPERRRKVLYVDLKLSDMQFGLRYSDPETERDYRFSDDLYVDRPPSVDQLVPWLRDMIAAGIGVIVIDDLSAVQETSDGTKHTLRLMRNLRELTDTLGVSILVIAGSRAHRFNVSVNESDLRRSRVLCDVADSVFGIGHHPHHTGSQYIMQTRSRTMPIYWDHTQPPQFTIQRSEDGFIGPKFDERFAEQIDEDTAWLIYQIKNRHDEGCSFRLIAEDLDISKSRAERLIKKWTPEIQRHFDDRIDWSDDCDDLDDEFDDETEEESDEDATPEAPEPQEDANTVTDPEPNALTESPLPAQPQEHRSPPDETILAEGGEPPLSSDFSLLTSHLRHAVDADGHNIWIETERRDGQPKVWYEYDSANTLWRREFRGFYISRTRKGPVVEAAAVEIARLKEHQRAPATASPGDRV